MWTWFTARLTAFGVGATLAAGCHTPWEPPDSSLRTNHAPNAPAVPAKAEVLPGTRGVQVANFQQPLPPAEETLDLGVALRLAGVDNPTIKLAREAVRESLANQLAAQSLLLPTVNVGGNFRDHRGALLASQGFVRIVDFQSAYVGTGAGVIGGGTAIVPGVRLFAHLGDAAYEPLAARQQVTVRRSDAHAIQNAILLDVAAEYLQLVGAEARLTVLLKGEADLAEVVRLTVAHANAGRGRQADADRASANLELLRSDLRRAEEDVAVASARLCRLLNLDPSTRLRTPGGSVQPIRLIPENVDLEGLVAESLRSRPEVLARAAAVAEAQTRGRQERVWPWLPTVSVGYSYGGFGGNVTASDFGSLRGRSEFDATAVWSVQNLGFGNRARVRVADAGVGAAIAGYDLTTNQIRREVTEAVAAARAAATLIKTTNEALAAAEDGFALEMERIKQVQGRPIEELDSFRQLLESRQEALRAVVAFNVAQFRLFVAVGNTPER